VPYMRPSTAATQRNTLSRAQMHIDAEPPVKFPVGRGPRALKGGVRVQPSVTVVAARRLVRELDSHRWSSCHILMVAIFSFWALGVEALMTPTADGHDDSITGIKARRTIGLKEIHCLIVARSERRLRYRVSERDNLAKIGPHRGWAGTECAIRVLQLADIHPECRVE
jgi:hypothetical protein